MRVHSAAEALPSNWTREVDPATKMVFYFNKLTGESSWENPVA
jgi:hypothetical protein